MQRWLVILLLSISLGAFAQLDTEFWFAPPEISEEHADRPVYIRIFGDRNTVVSVTFPSNPSLASATDIIPVSGYLRVRLDAYLDELEPQVTGIHQSGIHIEATAAVSAYYEVLGTGSIGIVNSDIFSLKGRNALGQDFYCTFQSIYGNHPTSGSISGIDLVATEDQTEVVIHARDKAGVFFDTIIVQLDKGETYSYQAPGIEPEDHLSGTHITSTKKIAVTLKDDSVWKQGWDLIADQIIPVDLIGSNYVVWDGQVVVTAVEDSTVITDVNGTYVLDEGESMDFPEVDFPKAYQGNKPFYLWHVVTQYTGSAGSSNAEIGGAIIPPLDCNGSFEVPFVRSSNDEFSLVIVVPKGAEDAFSFEGSNALIDVTNFETVAGNSDWLIGRFKYSQVDIPQELKIVLKNEEALFHMGMMNGNSNLDTRYGYFSSFSFIDLGVDITLCDNELAQLDAGPGRDSYEWSTGGLTQEIEVEDSGTYWVQVTQDGCIGRDTVVIDFSPKIEVDLGPDTSLCFPEILSFALEPDTLIYRWDNVSFSNTREILEPGIYWVKVSNVYGCSEYDTIEVIYNYPPDVRFPNDTVLCSGEELRFEKRGDSIYWNPDVVVPEFVIDYAGLVSLTMYNECGESTDSIYVEIPEVYVPNVVTPNNDGFNDQLEFLGTEAGTWHLSVLNRWGSEVFSSEDYENDWSPTGLEDGTYYFLLEEESRGDCYSFKNWLTIVR